jgi:L-asparaginase II
MVSRHKDGKDRRLSLTMGNPVLVELVRGPVVESRHCGAIAVVDSDGKTAFALGDVERPIFPRSAVKALQALVLVESGAADHCELGDEELALACASHGGELGHVAAVERMLARARLDPSALQCGVHWPLHQPSAQALARNGRAASALHNNCSGKHAGFLCVACATGADHRNYTEPTHPVQREVRTTIEGLTGAVLDTCAVDGCSVPTWAISLRDLALGFARFGSGQGLAPARASAAARLRQACAAKPWHVAGTGRFCTELMQYAGARVFVKTGAEGMFCGALPGQGFGIAIKCDDGAGRAAEVIMACMIAMFANWNGAERIVLDRFIRPTLRNWNGIVVGNLRPAQALTALDCR